MVKGVRNKYPNPEIHIAELIKVLDQSAKLLNQNPSIHLPPSLQKRTELIIKNGTVWDFTDKLQLLRAMSTIHGHYFELSYFIRRQKHQLAEFNFRRGNTDRSLWR